MNTLEGMVGAYMAETRTKKQELADAMGCSLVTFNRKLSGESELTISEARLLAGALHKTLDEICAVAP